LNISENRYNNLLKSKRIFETISIVGNEIGQDAFVIGGYVRDQLLNRETKDIDIVAIGSGIDFAKKQLKSLKVQLLKFLKVLELQ
jgi:poly(A) polymerase